MLAIYSVIIVFIFHEKFGISTITGGTASSLVLVWLIRFPRKNDQAE